MSFDPAYGLWGLALYSLMAATVLPGGSEIALFALIKAQPQLLLPALAVSTVGNTLGGMISWWCGRVLPQHKCTDRLRGQAWVMRWGSPILLFSWLPIVGDVFCLAAGWLRLHWAPCLIFMALGKFARYGLIASGAQAN